MRYQTVAQNLPFLEDMSSNVGCYGISNKVPNFFVFSPETTHRTYRRSVHDVCHYVTCQGLRIVTFFYLCRFKMTPRDAFVLEKSVNNNYIQP
jgi:hypothetical protein